MKQFILFSLLFITFQTRAQLELSRLSDSSYVFTTYRTFIDEKDTTTIPSNGLIKITSAGVLLIDTPWDTTQFQPLLDSIQKRFHSPVKWVISTHSHADRTAGLDYYKMKGIATYTSFSTRKICEERGEPQPEFVFYHDTVFHFGTWGMAIHLVKRTFKHPKWIIPGHQSWESKRSLKHTRKLIRKI